MGDIADDFGGTSVADPMGHVMRTSFVSVSVCIASCAPLPLLKPSVHYHIAGKQRVVRLLQCTATLLGSTRQWDSFSSLPQCWEQCAMGLLECTGLLYYNATMLGRSGQVYSFAALPRCKVVAGSVTPSVHCHTAMEPQAVGLLLCTATLKGNSGSWDSFSALPHYWEGVGIGSPLEHRHTVGK